MSEAAVLPLALRLPLHGSRLIEASAGTGKTWTIAALYLRLVLGHGRPLAPVPDNADGVNGPVEPQEPPSTTGFAQPLRPADILVMTFTRAATQELAARIRERLSEAAQFFRGELADDATDALLHALRADYPAGQARELAAWRLASAAETMDEAAIHTIDAWCHKVLNSYASLTGSLGEETLDGDTDALWQLAALDFWRNHVYPLQDPALEAVLQLWPDAQAWLQQSSTLKTAEPGRTTVDDNADSPPPLQHWLEQTLAQQQATLAQLAQGWPKRIERLQQWLDAQTDKNGPHATHWNGTRLRPQYYDPWLQALRNWAAAPTPRIEGFSERGSERLSPAGMAAARSAKAPPLATDALPPEFALLQQLQQELAQLPPLREGLLAYAAHCTHQRWRQLKAQQGLIDFADLLARVQQALQGPHGPALRTRLLAEYPVALVDEFQDTSPGQYQVLRQLYRPEQNDARCALLLIGDPKQSIYGFRGADIHSYLAARHETAGRHYALDTNFRSSHAMVGAVNHLFLQAEQRVGPGAFRFRHHDADHPTNPANDNPLPFVPVRAHGLRERLCDRHGTALPALTLCTQAQAQSREAAHTLFAELCAEQIVTWLQRDALCFDALAAPGETDRAPAQHPLQPGDIAILVRERNQAALVQRALRRRGLSAVYLSDRESVFASPEALDLVAWLQAVALPGDVALARAAFATPLLALPLAQLQAGIEHEEVLDDWLALLQQLHEVWRRQGILPMLRQTIHRLGLARHWLAAPDGRGERKLTNVLHLAELLQQASTWHDGEHGLIRHLVQHIHRAQQGAGGMAAEEQTVRLESDARLIQIVTVHKSKGLEYPVVMLPFASDARIVRPAAHPAGTLPDGAEADDGSLPDSPASPGDDEERLREDLRLLYVALTRARHALWVGFPVHKRMGAATKTPSAQTRSSGNTLHRSALGCLASGDNAVADADWWPLLRHWQTDCAGIQVTLAPEAADALPCSRYSPPQQALHWQPLAPYPSGMERDFAIASFSLLTRGIGAATSPAHPTGDSGDSADADGTETDQPFLWQPVPRRADDEILPPDTTAPITSAAGTPAPDAAPWHALRGSARLGDWMHQSLEWLQAEGFPVPLTNGQRQRIERLATLAGFDAERAALLAWLEQVLARPLPPAHAHERPALPLGTFERSLPELEFWLPVGHAETAALDALCRTHCWPGQPRPPLAPRHWQGMLMGFADLVLEHQGRFWVLDYKTNRLGDAATAYDTPALRQAVLQHRYDLQALLYWHALHRLLQQRLPHYQPAQHLGGAMYWFLRGVDHANAGLLHFELPLQALATLDRLLDSHHCPPATEQEAPC